MSALSLSFHPSRAVVRFLTAVGFAFLIGVGAHLKIYLPFTPVPVTFQTLFLLIGASSLRRYDSLQMVGWYLLLGFAGVPLFSGQANGFAYLLGPTGGYLIGFALAAAMLGFFEIQTKGRQFLLFVAAHLIIFVPGVAWLKAATGSTWSQALQMGFYPFLFGDLLKSSVAFCCWVLFLKRKS